MKYDSVKMVTILESFINEMTAEPSIFWRHCSVYHIACLLNVSRETIYAWRNKYPEFSDTNKKWESKRNALFLELKNKNSAWIFLAKNWLGMKDNQIQEHSGGITLKIEKIITDERPDEWKL